MYEVCVTKEFCSAHFLRDYEGLCANLHGHNWKVEVCFRHPDLQPNGILIDFIDVETVLDGILKKLDHSVINEIPPFTEMNPTSETLAYWIYHEIKQNMPSDAPLPHRVTVWETPGACATYWDESA